jgi:oligopeptide transport system ATP-binding protein
MAAQSATPLLKVEGLKQYFKVNKNFTVKAVDDVSFEIYPGETYGLVGESGSGKSTIGRSIIRLYDPTAGKITFDGQDISGRLSHAQNNTLRTQIQMIFQDPMASLNPRKKVEDIIGEGLDIHHMYKTQDERREKVEKILEKVGLAPEHAERYPHQFSGGQRQRVGIARALIMNPKLIIADECISALDVSIQAQVVNLMKDIQQETGTAYLFIAHDLSMVKYISDRIGVLHLGHLLETGTTEEIFANPIHPYGACCRLSRCRTRWWKSAAWPRLTTMPLPASTTAKAPATSSAAATTSSVPMKSLQSGVNKMKTQVS